MVMSPCADVVIQNQFCVDSTAPGTFVSRKLADDFGDDSTVIVDCRQALPIYFYVQICRKS
jgi:hypothetical protein